MTLKDSFVTYTLYQYRTMVFTIWCMQLICNVSNIPWIHVCSGYGFLKARIHEYQYAK